MKRKNSDHEIFDQYTGKNVEIMLRPDIPAISGKVVKCNENFIAVGNSLLSYQMIWGIKVIDDNSEELPKVEKNLPTEVPQEIPVAVEPKVVEIREEAPKVQEPVKAVKKEKIISKPEWEDKIFEGELIQFHPRRKFGSIFCPELKDFGVPVIDEDRIFVHANQISDEDLKKELLEKDLKDNNHNPMIRVTFRVSMNEKGSCADDVQAKEKIKIQAAPVEVKPVEVKVEEKIEEKKEVENEENFEQLLEKNLDWKKQTFEGELISFNHERMFGFISCSDVEKYMHETEEGDGNFEKKIFVHLNQINDIDLRQRLLDEKNPKPKIKVIFALKDSEKGLVAINVRSKFRIPSEVLQVQTSLALYEEGEIEYFRRYESIPHGKIRVNGNKLYKFYEESVTDPALLVFLECSPSAEGQKVRFTKANKGKDIIIQNLEASEPFPEYKVNDWERSGLLQRARERLKIK